MLSLTSKGLFCEAGGFHIDPHRAVDTALITHAHSDHARSGSRHYFCATSSVSLLRHRIGARHDIQGVPYRERLRFGEVEVSFHPAGHILGSAQIRLQLGSEVWVVSGDYKRQSDPTCEPFEVVPCDTFVTEATFGRPAYVWPDTEQATREIVDWWDENANDNSHSLLFCYSLGKAQRILAELRKLTHRRVLVYGEIEPLTRHYRDAGLELSETLPLEELSSAEVKELRGELILATHSIRKSDWPDRLQNPPTAFASGWMVERGGWMSRAYERGFVISDHADWPDLLRTCRETGARRILVLGGKNDVLARHLRKKAGVDAWLLTPELKIPPYSPVQTDLFTHPS